MSNQALDIYRSEHVVRTFAAHDALTLAEVAALGDAGERVRGDVLDVGVGGGRTTAHLRENARSYRALDISEGMVAACRARHPGVAVDVGDARDLGVHRDASYDLVMFSFNGIDYVGHHERAAVLSEAFRVLRPDGAFVYSSHNLRNLDGRLPPLTPPRLEPTANPARLLVRAVRTLASAARCRRNRRRLGGQQRLGDDWALVNDEAFDHSLLTVYVEPELERQALHHAGFDEVATFDFKGRRNPRGANDPWLYYFAHKPARDNGHA